jgi:hypothetical protein
MYYSLTFVYGLNALRRWRIDSTVPPSRTQADECQPTILFSFCRSIARQVPDCPLGFVLYARSCLGFQQHRTAHVFSDKGVLVADRVQDEISK